MELSGTTHPATTKKADAEGSPGTLRSTGLREDARTRTMRTLTPGFDRQIGPRLRQHLLGVCACRHRLADDRRAVGREAGENDRGLHLGTCHLGGPVDAVQDATPDA